MRQQIFTFFAFIWCLFLNSQLQASEIAFQLLQTSVSENIQLKIEELTRKIDNINPLDVHELDVLLFDRGIVFLFCGEYEDAINDFNSTLLDISEQNNFHSEKNVARALWGRTLSYAFLGRVDEFNNDMDNFAELTGLHNDCKCPPISNANIFEPALFQEKIILCSSLCSSAKKSDIMLCDVFCEDTVDNTVRFLKAMCCAIRDSGIRATLYIFIDGLGDKAKRCCRARGFWRDCVDPMVEVAEKWKLFGIPNDPYWD